MFQNAIQNALNGSISYDLAINLQALHAAVCKRIQCSCGSILDSRSAVLYENKNGSAICCGLCHDKKSDKILPTVKITDSRLYNLDGTLKAPKPKFKLKRLKKPIEFWVRIRAGQTLEVGIKFLEVHGYKFYLHGEAGDWVLSEYRTGLKASKGKTQKQVLQLFESTLSNLGKDLWIAAIEANSSRYELIND